jgi:hypothetical protein
MKYDVLARNESLWSLRVPNLALQLHGRSLLLDTDIYDTLPWYSLPSLSSLPSSVEDDEEDDFRLIVDWSRVIEDAHVALALKKLIPFFPFRFFLDFYLCFPCVQVASIQKQFVHSHRVKSENLQ